MSARPLHLVLLAGGRGLRAGGADGVPKQFRPTARGALFAVSLRTFLVPLPEAPWRLASVTVAAPEDRHADVAREVARLQAEVRRGHDALPFRLARPGETRTASTWQAVLALRAEPAPADADLVAVHDAARPFASLDLLDRLARAALDAGAAVPGVPVPDTIVRHGAGATAYLDRSELVAVQTPQVFRWDVFAAAHAWAAAADRAFTDDGGLVAARGTPPAVVAGEAGNGKVTTAADWDAAARRLAGDPDV